MKLGVSSASAMSEPRTTATAATDFPRFRDYAAFRAYGPDCHRRDCWCVYVGIDQNTKPKENKSLHVRGVSLGLTLASLGALKPIVISVPVPGTLAILMPITTRSATTESAGFGKRAALWTRHRTGRGNDKSARADWCGDWCADYFQLPFR